MINLLLQSINVIPSILMLALLIYFYTQKRVPGLLILIIAHIVLTLIVIVSIFGVTFLSSRSASVTEIGRFYAIIRVVSLITQLITIVGMGILLQNYPLPKDKEKIADSF